LFELIFKGFIVLVFQIKLNNSESN